jgi:peptide-methionine (R)-S-oxide reductase
MAHTKVVKSDEEWRAELSPERYAVLRGKSTERPWSGEYCELHAPGFYRCAACGSELFRSESKFESGSGWPSFFQPVSDDAVYTERDVSLGMVRDEALCATCDSHLGHVFTDGPPPTGLRWCINSLALEHEPDPAAS